MRHLRRYLPFCLLTLALVLGSGCRALFGPEETAEIVPTPTARTVPTFTPTPESVAMPTANDAPAAVAEATQVPVTLATVMAAVTETGVSTATIIVTSTAGLAPARVTAAPSEADDANAPYVIVAAEIINVRSGPGTNYDVIGSATAGEQWPILGRTAQGDWWQVCCFGAEQPGWLYGALLTVENGESVAVAANIPPAPTQAPAPEPTTGPTVAPAAAAVVDESVVDEPVVDESVVDEPVAEPTAPPAVEAQPAAHSETGGNFDPNAQFHIVHYHVRGYEENNGGIFNNGGQHMIFVTVLDENGAGIDGAVVKDALADDLTLVTGNKGPGKTEFEMFWEPYKLYVESIPSGPVTSQVSNQMNTAKPHIPDIVGKLGPPEHEYAICPTVDDRCEPPFFHAHWSYEITFQKVR